jgi:hypothetical protein
MALIVMLAHAAVLLAPMQQVAPVGPGTDAVQSDRVRILKVSDQLPEEVNRYASLGYRVAEVLSNLGARGYTYLEGRIFMRLPQRGTGR